MAAKRSRTGCATCRKRKLKCDEARPICGQCTKSRRECVASEGVAFRHEQNAGLNSESKDGDRSLGNFFKYREGYSTEQLNSFVPIPTHLEWRLITDVYAEDSEQALPRTTSSPQAYQREVASHSLEALSTAAAENKSYHPPVTYNDNFYQGASAGYGPVVTAIQGPKQNYNLSSLLNPSAHTPAAMIDPNLDITAVESLRQAAENEAHNITGAKHNGEDKPEENQENATSEEHMARLLNEFGEQTA